MAIVSNLKNTTNNSDQQPTKIITGKVLDIILDIKHPKASRYGGYKAIGTIFYKDNKVNIAKDSIINSKIAVPLYSFIKNYPIINEMVLITFITLPNGEEKSFYFPIINIWNNPHHSALPLIQSENKTEITTNDTEANYGEYFKELDYIKPLLPFEGDIILEGRFGNSIRFGSTNVKQITPDYSYESGTSLGLNSWSKEGLVSENGNPITIIRNGQFKSEESSWVNTLEDINKDNSSIYLTSGQIIKDFIPASLHQSSFGANLEVDYSNIETLEIEEQTFEDLMTFEEEPVLSPPKPPSPDPPIEEEYDDRPSEDETSTGNQKLSPDTELPSTLSEEYAFNDNGDPPTPPPSQPKHPDADVVEGNNGFYIIEDSFDRYYVEVKNENMDIIYTGERYFSDDTTTQELIDLAKFQGGPFS